MNCREIRRLYKGEDEKRSHIHTQTWCDRSHLYTRDDIVGTEIQNITYFSIYINTQKWASLKVLNCSLTLISK